MNANTWYTMDHGTAANSVRADRVDIDVSGSGYVARIQSSTKDNVGNNWHTQGGRNSLEADAIRIHAESAGGEAYVVVTGKHGETDIQGTDRGNTFHFESRGASAYDVVTTDNGDLPFSPHTTHITSGGGNDSINILATGKGTSAKDGHALGLYSSSTGHNRIDAGSDMDTITIEAIGTNNVMGMSAGLNKQGGQGWGGTDASNAIINTENVSILGQSGGGNAYGMFAYNQQAASKWGYNPIQGSADHGNTITVTAESSGGKAWGMMSQGTEFQNRDQGQQQHQGRQRGG